MLLSYVDSVDRADCLGIGSGVYTLSVQHQSTGGRLMAYDTAPPNTDDESTLRSLHIKLLCVGSDLLAKAREEG